MISNTLALSINKPSLPSGSGGFAIFSLPHIAVIGVIVLACVLGAIFFRKLSPERQKKVGLIMGIVIAAIDVSHYIVYYFMGILSVYAIPLHLCALAVYVCLLFGIFRADWMGQVLYALCLPGAWSAILFPNWTSNALCSYPSIDSFVIHGLIVTFITMQLSAKNIRPRLSAIWKPILFLCVTAPIAALANRLWGTNFMFISNSSEGSPLDFLWTLAAGNHFLYLLDFAILVLAGMTILYLPFLIAKKCRK